MSIQLNPRLARQLETYDPQRLRAIMLWFNTDRQSVQAQSETLAAILDEVETADIDTCYRLASQLELKDVVEFSLLNEFGPAIEKRPSFIWLTRNLLDRFRP